MEPLVGVVTRFLALVAGAVLTITLIMVSPRRAHRFTGIGVRRLTFYLMYPMVIEFPRQLDWFVDYSGPGPTLLVTIGIIALNFVLSRRPAVQAGGPSDRASTHETRETLSGLSPGERAGTFSSYSTGREKCRGPGERCLRAP